jgi:predicted transcriptional regulator
MLKGSWRTLLTGLRGAAGAGRDPLAPALGRLEREVMAVVWRSERVSVRGVQAQIPRAIAYTTVMTTLDRLFKKGLLERTMEGRAFLYRAAFTRDEVEAAVASGLLRGLLESGAGLRPVLSNLVDAIGDRDRALLDELEALVKEKRRERPE